MTRIFGFETKEEFDYKKIDSLVDELFQNMQLGLNAVLDQNWFSYGLGFIVVYEDESFPVSIYRAYQGIKREDNIRDIFEEKYQFRTDKKIKAIFGVIECEPDNGINEFEAQNYANENEIFPIESDEWYVMTNGVYSHSDEFTDIGFEWYNKEMPWKSVTKYLNLKPSPITFSWICPKRRAIVFAVKKNASKIIFESYLEKNVPTRQYLVMNNPDSIIYAGVRDRDNGNFI